VVSDNQNREVERIAGELRASIRKARVSLSPSPTSRVSIPEGAFEPDSAIEIELAVLRSTYDMAGAPFTSHRRVLGRFIIFFKNIARELLVQLLARQSAFNGAAVRAITHLKQRLDTLAEEQRRITQRLDALEARFGAGQQQALPQQTRTSNGSEPTGGFGSAQLNQRLDALEKAAAEDQRGARRDD
jgi:hypothetical protein